MVDVRAYRSQSSALSENNFLQSLSVITTAGLQRENVKRVLDLDQMLGIYINMTES